ncbi:MAG: C40 family peptidase [Clostridia bacterium]|nr:C40 family peptidase [Clostridia bacterium]
MKFHERIILNRLITTLLLSITIFFSATSAKANNFNFLAIAKECKNYLVDNGFSYHKGHYEYPLQAENGTTIDCSGYVGWCIYEYQGGNFECKSSKWYLQTAKQLYNGKESDSPEYTIGWTAVKGSENFQTGDILCYSGHVHIYYSPSVDEHKPYAVLNAGSDSALDACITNISENYFKKAQYAIRLP